MNSKVTAVDDAVAKIKSGDTVTRSGNGEALLPDLVLQALERKFLGSDQPRDLTLHYPIIPGMQREGTGLDRLAHPGLIKRIITGTYYTLNVSNIGGKQNLGGFMDIIWKTPQIVFCGAFLASGFKADIRGEKLVILNEGKIPKLVKHPAEKTFDAGRAVQQGQKVTYITERAVFDLDSRGIVLKEIAPGVDLQKDILDKMEFEPIINGRVQTMSKRLFRTEKMGLKEAFFD